MLEDENLRVGFFTEDAHHLLTEVEVSQEIEEDLSSFETFYQDEKGCVFDYSEVQEVLDAQIDETEVKSKILDENPELLAYLNSELQEYLEEEWGNNGILIKENWPEQVYQKLDSNEYKLEDFDLDESMVAITTGEDPDDLRWSYMRDTFWDRYDGPVVERPI